MAIDSNVMRYNGTNSSMGTGTESAQMFTMLLAALQNGKADDAERLLHGVVNANGGNQPPLSRTSGGSQLQNLLGVAAQVLSTTQMAQIQGAMPSNTGVAKPFERVAADQGTVDATRLQMRAAEQAQAALLNGPGALDLLGGVSTDKLSERGAGNSTASALAAYNHVLAANRQNLMAASDQIKSEMAQLKGSANDTNAPLTVGQRAYLDAKQEQLNINQELMGKLDTRLKETSTLAEKAAKGEIGFSEVASALGDSFMTPFKAIGAAASSERMDTMYGKAFKQLDADKAMGTDGKVFGAYKSMIAEQSVRGRVFTSAEAASMRNDANRMLQQANASATSAKAELAKLTMGSGNQPAIKAVAERLQSAEATAVHARNIIKAVENDVVTPEEMASLEATGAAAQAASAKTIATADPQGQMKQAAAALASRLGEVKQTIVQKYGSMDSLERMAKANMDVAKKSGIPTAIEAAAAEMTRVGTLKTLITEGEAMIATDGLLDPNERARLGELQNANDAAEAASAKLGGRLQGVAQGGSPQAPRLRAAAASAVASANAVIAVLQQRLSKTTDPAMRQELQSSIAEITARRDNAARMGAMADDGRLTPQEAADAVGMMLGRPSMANEFAGHQAALAAADPRQMAGLVEQRELDSIEHESGAAQAGVAAFARANPAAMAALAAQRPTEKHEVRSGDWTSSIAARYRNANGSPVTVEQLAMMPENAEVLKDPARIRPGQQIVLPAGAFKAETGAPAPVAGAAVAAGASAPSGPRRGIAPKTISDADRAALVKDGKLLTEDAANARRSELSAGVPRAANTIAIEADVKAFTAAGLGKIGTDAATMMGLLKKYANASAQDRAQFQAILETTTGTSLDDHLSFELKGTNLERARDLAAGKYDLASAKLLKRMFVDGMPRDTLAALKDIQGQGRMTGVATEFKRVTGQSLTEALGKYLDGRSNIVGSADRSAMMALVPELNAQARR